MPELLERDQWCLWASNGQQWYLMDKASGPDARSNLEGKAARLRPLFTNRKFAVVFETEKP